VSMHGFLSHRSGIKLEPPFTTYRRPRPMHPADGVKVFELDVTFWNGESDAVQRSLRRLLGPNLDESRLQTHPNAWGGYMDAGDWDRRSQHLTATWEHLELLDLFPEFFEKQKLALPPGEANDHLPDVLNEALWNLDFYRRLQRHHGGVGGGVESTSHPRPGEASWQESLLLGTFAPDPESSLRYAACAARAARLIAKYDQQAANEYAASAKKAWQWANANEERVIREETDPARVGRNTDPERLREAVRNTRALAAVALYRLTNEKDYHRAYQASTALSDPRDDPGKQLDSVFAYATLPTHLADAALQRKAIAWFEQAAADSLAFASNTAFDVTCRVPLLPVIGYVSFFSAPETTLGAILPRAHYLTGKVEYLRGALAATQFTAGANPMNMTLTTGVGHAYPRHPLHVDSHHAGIEPPDGVTVYGMGDPSLSDGSVDWVHTWFLSKTMIPGSRTWPTTEFYVDLGNWPASNEYTVHQTFRPVSFYWGYLAARP
jgi:endoglucanase